MQFVPNLSTLGSQLHPPATEQKNAYCWEGSHTKAFEILKSKGKYRKKNIGNLMY